MGKRKLKSNIMSQPRSKKYFKSNAGKKTFPIQSKEEVAANSDNKIDQDFPDFPHAHSKPDIISPKTAAQKKTAAVNIKDG
jgi:hypothetical protein